MKSAILTGLLAGTACCFMQQTAQAQDFDGVWDKERWQIRGRLIGVLADGDGSVVPGGAATNATHAYTPEVDLTYFLNRSWALELIAATSKHEVEAGGGELGTAWALPPTLTLQYHFARDQQFSPYIGAGINYTMFYGEDEAGATTDLDVGNSVGWAAQIGFDYWINDHWGFNADLKYVDIDVDVSVAGGTVNARDVGIDPVIAGLGVSYRF